MDFKPEFTMRHMDIIPVDAMKKKIHVVGAGAIGSFVVLSLAKMGFNNIHVYDFDTIDEANIGNQFYSTNTIGKKKVAALSEMIHMFSGIRINTYDVKLDEKSSVLPGDILVAAVDSMAVRKMLYDSIACHWLIDPRMGAEYAMMKVLNVTDGSKDDHKSYQNSLYSDDEAVRERCTAKTTIYTVNLIAGQVVKAIKDITTSDKGKENPITDLEWSIKTNSMLAFSNGVKL